MRCNIVWMLDTDALRVHTHNFDTVYCSHNYHDLLLRVLSAMSASAALSGEMSGFGHVRAHVCDHGYDHDYDHAVGPIRVGHSMLHGLLLAPRSAF